MKTFVLFLFVCSWNYAESSDDVAVFDVTWNYNQSGQIGPSNWPNTVPMYCNGTRQSPVNINMKDVVHNPKLKPLAFAGYDKVQSNVDFTINNNGHGLAVTVKHQTLRHVPINLEFKSMNYTLASFHFHWGKVNERGSEHTMDGKASSAEMHILHYNSMYNNLSEALKYKGGVVVWGQFIQVATEDNTMLRDVFKYTKNVNYEGEKLTVPALQMSSLVPPDSTKYYYYSGSLTTPTCDEVITWIVNKEAIKITADQIELLRSLHAQNKTVADSQFIYDNYRPVQPLNGRVVERNFKDKDGSSASIKTASAIIFPIFVTVWKLFA